VSPDRKIEVKEIKTGEGETERSNKQNKRKDKAPITRAYRNTDKGFQVASIETDRERIYKERTHFAMKQLGHNKKIEDSQREDRLIVRRGVISKCNAEKRY